MLEKKGGKNKVIKTGSYKECGENREKGGVSVKLWVHPKKR